MKIQSLYKQYFKVYIPLLLTLLFISPALGQLKQMQYEEIPTRVIPDAGYEGKSLLIVETTLSNLSFESTRGILPGSVNEVEPGLWWVTLKPGVQLISISSEGFLPLKEIRHNFVMRQAWKIKVTPKTQEVNELPVVIRVEPSGTDVRIDGKTTDISGSVKLAIGEHSIEITKSGYVTIKDNFTVNADNIFFEYTLEKPKLCIVEVSTEPSGAEVWIDGVKMQGTTPISDFYNSGRYPIKITKDKYLPVDETILIDQSKAKNSFSYRLESNTGTIIISSEPEVNMDVTLNGKSVGKTPVTLKEQAVGDYTVSGSHEYYTAESLEYTLQRGETWRAILKPQENFAILTVNTTSGAAVYLNNQKLTSLRDLRLSPQTIRLRAEKPKCKTVETTLILRRGTRETVDLYLDEQTGTIAISVDPPEAEIELNGDAGEHYTSNGTKIFENIPVGSYELEVSLKGYKTDKRSLRLRADETLRERITLEKGGGGEGPLPGMVFVEIPAGSFEMGSNDGDSDEKPVHTVRLSSFYMMTTEVTNAMFVEFLNTVGRRGSGNKPWFEDKSQDSDSRIQGSTGNFRVESGYENHPVVEVSWYGARAFCDWLERKGNLKYRLPSESEWEYACRAGTNTRFYSGNSDSDLDRVAWHGGNSNSKTHPVGQKQPNAWGLYDMHGNVYEWCEDVWHDSYSGAPTDGSAWMSGGNQNRRVLRGGSWNGVPNYCRCANRYFNYPVETVNNNGFRVVGF